MNNRWVTCVEIQHSTHCICCHGNAPRPSELSSTIRRRIATLQNRCQATPGAEFGNNCSGEDSNTQELNNIGMVLQTSGIERKKENDQWLACNLGNFKFVFV